MDKKTILLDGNEFFDLHSFYDVVENGFTKDLGWDMGRNLDAFHDVLRGGFGVYEFAEPVRLIWVHSDKSRKDLGWKETMKYISAKLTTCHPSHVEFVKRDLALAESHEGKTLFDLLVEIIKRHDHIELSLQ
jgi:RNAse (barnase) inhibitor barstar